MSVILTVQDQHGILTLDASWMILDTMHIIVLIAVYHLRQSFGLDIRPTLVGVHRLHDYHVPAITTLFDESASSRACFERRADFNDIAANCNWETLTDAGTHITQSHTQEVVDAPFSNSRIYKYHFRANDCGLVDVLSALSVQNSGERTSKSLAFSMSLATRAIWRSRVRAEPVFHISLDLLHTIVHACTMIFVNVLVLKIVYEFSMFSTTGKIRLGP